MIKNNGDVANYKQLIFGVALMIILISLMILLILIVFIILFPIYVNVHLSFINGQPFASIRISLLKLKIYEKRWDSIDDIEPSIIDEHLVEYVTGLKNKKIDKGFCDVVQFLKEIKQVGELLIRNTMIHKLDWITYLGTGDASSTGLISGGLWAVKGAVERSTHLLNTLDCQPQIRLIPYFQHKVFKSDFMCIFSIKIVKAIFILIKMIGDSKTK